MDAKLLLARAKKTMARKRKLTLSQEARKILKTLMMLLIIMLFGASVLFIFNTTKMAQRGYDLRQIEITNQTLRAENRDLKQKVLGAESYKNIKESEVIKNMEEMENPIFIPRKR